ncbi:MAG: (2Fe-2S)-binding protein [Planctomycetales bacterium]|nr:(2Fe-2S)-binding protein [Planctomycetales bacterium]
MGKRKARGGGGPGFSRRGFLAGVGGLAGATALGAGAAAQDAGPEKLGPGPAKFSLRVNGQERALECEPRVTLLDALRERLGLTGAKRVCDRGECGACTVLLDGQPAYSCMVLAVDAQGREVTTVEGLGTPTSLHPVQEAFVQADGYQCGFCTPGQVVAAAALLARVPDPTPAQAREALAGNVCRCGAYPRIVEAALTAAKAIRARGARGGRK